MNNRETNQRLKKGQKNIYEMNLGFVNSNSILTPEVAERLTKLKFLSGESYYTPSELAFLRQWIEKHGAQDMYDIFNRHALKGQIARSTEYQESPLQKLFHELIPLHEKVR